MNEIIALEFLFDSNDSLPPLSHIKYAISAIIVNEGIFVKMASPKEMPDRNDMVLKCLK
jgi:hypothetical protein